ERSSSHDLVAAAVRLERTDRRNKHGGVRLESAHARLDIEKLLGTEVGTEAGLGHEDIGQFQADLVGQDRTVAVGDIAERASMDEGRGMLNRLQKIWLEGIDHQSGHRAARANVIRRYRLLGTILGDDDSAK